MTLSSEAPLRKLHFTCHKLEKIDSESLGQIWRDRNHSCSGILYNSEFFLTAASLGTNDVLLMKVHCSSIFILNILASMHKQTFKTHIKKSPKDAFQSKFTVYHSASRCISRYSRRLVHFLYARLKNGTYYVTGYGVRP